MISKDLVIYEILLVIAYPKSPATVMVAGLIIALLKDYSSGSMITSTWVPLARSTFLTNALMLAGV